MLHTYREPLRVEQVPLPERLEPGAALVRVVGSNLCGSDVHCWEGKLATRTLPLPIVLGYEIVGEVVAIDPADSAGRTVSVCGLAWRKLLSSCLPASHQPALSRRDI